MFYVRDIMNKLQPIFKIICEFKFFFKNVFFGGVEQCNPFSEHAENRTIKMYTPNNFPEVFLVQSSCKSDHNHCQTYFLCLKLLFV